MKKPFFIILTFFPTLSNISFSQQIDSVHSNKTDYLLKSKRQETTGWILLGGGAALTVGVLVVAINSSVAELGSVISTGEDNKSFVAGAVIFYTGLASMLFSIPLFVASAHNKKKAMQITLVLKTETSPLVQNNAMHSCSYPVLSLKASFRDWF